MKHSNEHCCLQYSLGFDARALVFLLVIINNFRGRAHTVTVLARSLVVFKPGALNTRSTGSLHVNP